VEVVKRNHDRPTGGDRAEEGGVGVEEAELRGLRFDDGCRFDEARVVA